MKTKIIWSEDAGNELLEIISYIKKNSGKINAKNIHKKIMDTVIDASDNAEGRRISPLLRDFGIIDIHQINVNPWAIYYRVENNTMKIISIIDTRRNLEEVLYQKMLEGKITSATSL
ncbi:MAG: type II toxin-antitoxin system RelE/ParE family toxin [Treponema sp.]|nr:type II toxin-antitoxin system RelE/ParE family toxin [Treponema sp.]